MSFYNVCTYGAVGDGLTVDTAAVQSAINACYQNGGGHVIFERGTFVCGTLYLRSHVHLEIRSSARLVANPDIGDYGNDTHYNRYVNETDMDRCFIYAEDAQDIGLEGFGEIDGHAEAFPNQGSIYRPMMIRFLRCRGIHLKQLRLNQAAAWTTAFLDSEDIWIDSVDICNDKRYNGDGLDFDGCRNVFVTRCKIKGTDDNLCLQASSRDYPVRNIHISDCHFTSVCAGIRIGLKSVGDISGVTITGCTFEEVWREGIKIECTEGGSISDIVIQGCTMHNVTRPVFVILNNRLETIGSSVGLTEMPEIGTMKRILIENIIAVDDEDMKQTHYRFENDIMGEARFNGIRIDANVNHPIEDLMLKNILYTTIGGVRKEEIPKEYPPVYDLKKERPEGLGSENYYPDWSRAAFLDVRNVKNLVLEGIYCKALEEDEREPWYVEGCGCVKREITIW